MMTSALDILNACVLQRRCSCVSK